MSVQEIRLAAQPLTAHKQQLDIFIIDPPLVQAGNRIYQQNGTKNCVVKWVTI